jgi:uncharacterized membrane protein
MDFEFIIGLAVLFFIGMPIISYFSLRSRVSQLEDRVAQLMHVSEGGQHFPVQADLVSQTNSLVSDIRQIPRPRPVSEYQPTALPEYRPLPASADSPFYLWLKQDFLVKIGALLLILALAWFVSYAFAHNWIGPVGRIMLGLLFGVGVLVLGMLRMPKSDSQGAIFTVLGSVVVIMTTAAAQYVYEMFPPIVALVIILLTVAYVAFVSLQYERSSLALSGLITALVAPFLINVSYYDPFLLMVYALAVVAGTLWVVWRLRAEMLTLAALIGVVAYTPLAYELDSVTTLLFAFVFTGIFFVTNIISLARRYTEWVSPVHVLTAVITGVYLTTMVLVAAPEEWVSAYLVLWSLVFAYGSYQVFIRTLNKIPFYIYAAVSVILLGTATAAETDGALLTIMLTLEVLVSIILLSRLSAHTKVLNIATALLCVPGLLTLEHIDSYRWHAGIPMDDLFALIIFTAALVVAGLVRREEQASGLLESGQRVLYSIAGIYTATMLWLVLHAVLSDMAATMFALIIYSVCGLILYITGRTEGDGAIKKAGVVVLGFVIVRLLLVDVWELDMAWRIITFLVIGLLFMSTAFLPKGTKKLEQ